VAKVLVILFRIKLPNFGGRRACNLYASPPEKNQFLTNVFQEGSCFHLPMEWTHLFISMNFIQVYVNFEVKIASENLNILVRTYLTEKKTMTIYYLIVSH